MGFVMNVGGGVVPDRPAGDEPANREYDLRCVIYYASRPKFKELYRNDPVRFTLVDAVQDCLKFIGEHCSENQCKVVEVVANKVTGGNGNTVFEFVTDGKHAAEGKFFSINVWKKAAHKFYHGEPIEVITSLMTIIDNKPADIGLAYVCQDLAQIESAFRADNPSVEKELYPK